MTFLELCQRTLVASGTGNRDSIPSLTNLGQHEQNVVDYVVLSWQLIQKRHEGWSWRERDFKASLRTGVDMYAWSELYETPAGSDSPQRSIPQIIGWHNWLNRPPGNVDGPLWVLRNAPGQPATYTSLLSTTYEAMRIRRLTFDTPGKPTFMAIDPERRLLVHPIPDAEYVLHGRHYTGVEILSDANQQPRGISDDYHEAIVWRAVMMVHADDDAGATYQFAQMNYDELLDSMERIYLPPVRFGGALA